MLQIRSVVAGTKQAHQHITYGIHSTYGCPRYSLFLLYEPAGGASTPVTSNLRAVITAY
jgi:hypothetical protein